MNVKSKKSLQIVIVAILAMTVMCTTATAADLRLSKESIPPGATYTVGDTINYELVVENTHTTCNATLDVWDDYPNGTSALLAHNVDIPPGESRTYYTSYVTTSADVPRACNLLRVEGTQCGVSAYLSLGTCNYVNPPPTPTPTPPPPDVPATSPIGLVALVGLLGIFGAGMIVRRR